MEKPTGKSEYANICRAIFDQELHDQVLTEVIESNIESKAFNLFNTKAKERALYLLEGSDEYFN